MMELNDFCRELGIGTAEEFQLKPVWNDLTLDWNGELPFFLNMEFFDRVYPFCKSAFPMEQARPLAEEVIRIAKENPVIALLAHAVYRGAYLLNPIFEFTFLKDPFPLLGEKCSGMFSVMIAMGAYPLIVKGYKESEIPEKYARDIMQWVGGTMSLYRLSNPDRIGRPFQFNWIRRYIDKTLFRIGRLEFLSHPYPDFLPAIYRNREGDLRVFCRDGWTFRADGQRATMWDQITFTAQLTVTEKTITGTRCLPDGSVDFEHTETIRKEEWFPAASPWDNCPSMHISAGLPMPFEEVKESMLAARTFFETCFHQRVPMFCCWSWIFCPAWEEYLPNSNMVRFRREAFAFPSTVNDKRPGMTFIFGRADVSPEELPVSNKMQAIYQEAHRKNQTGYGGIFVLTEDLEKLGNQYYRK